jgi:hypothetical protein
MNKQPATKTHQAHSPHALDAVQPRRCTATQTAGTVGHVGERAEHLRVLSSDYAPSGGWGTHGTDGTHLLWISWDSGNMAHACARAARTTASAHAQVLRLGKAITQTLSDYSHLLAFSCREVPLPLPLRHPSALIPSRASPQLLAFRALSMPQPGSLPRSQHAARTCEPCAALCRCVSAGVQELDAHTSKLPFDFPPSVCTRINNLDYLRNEVRCTRQWPALPAVGGTELFIWVGGTRRVALADRLPAAQCTRRTALRTPSAARPRLG